MLQKPSGCTACPLHTTGLGFVRPTGPQDARVAFIGEAPGADEAESGEPFVGLSGSRLWSIAKRAGLSREQVRVDNILHCKPPDNALRGESYERDAVAKCYQYLRPTMEAGHGAYVAVGAVATKALLGIHGKFKLNDWHGCPTKDHAGRWIIPTYHPAFLLRGQQRLTGVVVFDMRRAIAVANGTYVENKGVLRIDPSPDWFLLWIERYEAALAAGLEPWLAVDVETVEKLTGKEEDSLEGSNIKIVRINFAYNPDEGLTVPWCEPYISMARRLLASKGHKVFWNWRYDIPLLRDAGCPVERPWHEGMHLFKLLQSDLPLGLGFAAPFFSTYGAWKHLASTDPGTYAAIDPMQTLRIAFGCIAELRRTGMWSIYERTFYQLDKIVLHPAEDTGLLVDQTELTRFDTELTEKEARLVAKIQAYVGDGARPLVGYWKKPPKDRDPQDVLTVQLEKEVLCCTDCEAIDVTEKHKCKKVAENPGNLPDPTRSLELTKPKPKRTRRVRAAGAN